MSLSVEIVMNWVFKDLLQTMPTQFCLGHKGWLFSQISVPFSMILLMMIWYKVLCQISLTDPTRKGGEGTDHCPALPSAHWEKLGLSSRRV